jgi:hypothetical protein
MSDIDELFFADQQQQHQQLNPYFFTTPVNFSFSIGNFSDNNLINITNINENGSIIDTEHQLELTSLPYTIIFGFICACLCFLTVTGNLLVLITFRRIQTVSISKISSHRNKLTNYSVCFYVKKKESMKSKRM